MFYFVPCTGDRWENQLTYKESSNFYLQPYGKIMIIIPKPSPKIIENDIESFYACTSLT
jgi:hypothetical protein